MTRAFALLLLLVPVAACSSSDDLLVDRMGISDAKYKADLSDCKESSGGWFSFGVKNKVATCMEAKGYKVLMGKSNL